MSSLETDRTCRRAAVEELLVAERMPLLYRVQFHMYLVGSVPEDEPVEKIREHVEDAYYWLDDLEKSILETVGTPDPRVVRLREALDFISHDLDEYDEEGEEGGQGGQG